MGASTGKKARKSAKRKKKTETPQEAAVVVKRYSPLGWLVLFAPLSIVVFLLLFGSKIPYLTEQSSSEAEDFAAMVCTYGREDMKAGRLQSAYARFMEALKLKPDYAEAMISIAQIHYNMGDIPKAIEWLRRALALNPPQKDLVYNNLGLLLANNGDFNSALAMFNQALSSGMETDRIYSNIGNVNMSLENYIAAVEAYRAALNYEPTLKNTYAEMLLKVVSENYDDDESRLQYEAAKEHLDRGVTDEEVAVYDSVSLRRFSLDNLERAKRTLNLGVALEFTGNIGEAFQRYQESLKLSPNNPTAHYRLGRLYATQGRLNESRRHLETAVRLDPKDEKARQFLEEVKSVQDTAQKK